MRKLKKITVHKQLLCPECKTRMHKKLDGGRPYYECPSCGHKFRANGHKNRNGKTKPHTMMR